jgi:nicotinate-nucleotide adenylyltransferase
MKKDIILYGGSFNPITNGHMWTAVFVMDKLKEECDELWFMPCYENIWGKEMAEPDHRVNMIKLAIEHYRDKRLRCFDYEIVNKLSGCGSIEIIRRVFADYPQHNFSFLIGMDNANSMHKWAESEKLIKMMRFIVVSRIGVPQDDDKWYLRAPHRLLNGLNSIIGVKISSTMVRDQIKEGSLDGKLLPLPVIDYINDHKLYV